MAVVLFIILGVGLIQGAFILSTMQSMFPKGQKKNSIQKCISRFQVVPLILMQGVEIWLFVMIFLPADVPSPLNSAQGWILIFIAFFLWINMVFNYFAAMVKSPGYPPTKKELELNETTALQEEFCVKCERLRNQGTHHCSTCNTCVTLMSHHCPFTNNCIGQNNYVYFYLFLLYCTLGLVFCTYCTYSSFNACMMLNTERRSLLYPQYTKKVCMDLGDYPILFLVAVLLLIFMVLVLFYHTILILADLSMIDFLRIFQREPTLDALKRLWHKVIFRKKYLLRVLILNQSKSFWMFLVPMIRTNDNSSDEFENELPV